MKKFILIISILIGGIVFANNDIQAQNISVNINLNSQPSWGPVGYNYVDYYYLPDINVYYIVNSHRYVYLDGNRWVTVRYLPSRYRHYDLYNMYKVVLVGGSRTPWIHNRAHYREYSRFRNYRGQSVIRDSRASQYHLSRNNHYLWYRDSDQRRRSADNDRYTYSDRTNDRRSSSSRVEDSRTTNRKYSDDKKSSSRSNQNSDRSDSRSSRR